MLSNRDNSNDLSEEQFHTGIGTNLMFAGLGAGLMYYFDARSGNRRRALLRDKMLHAVHEIGDAADTAVRDLMHRIRGLGYESLSALQRRQVDDYVLVDRVRSKLGR